MAETETTEQQREFNKLYFDTLILVNKMLFLPHDLQTQLDQIGTLVDLVREIDAIKTLIIADKT